MICPLLLTIVLAAGPRVEAQTLAGQTLEGTIKDLGGGQLVLETADGAKTLSIEDLASVAPTPVKETSPVNGRDVGAWVELIDGSSLVARQFTAAKGRAKIVLVDDSPALEIPTQDIARVRFPPRSPALDAEWERLIQKPPQADLLVIRRGDALDYHQGVLRDVSDATVDFELEGDRLPVKRPKVAGLVYYHPPGRKLAESIGRMNDAVLGRVSVAALAGGAKLSITLPSGLKIERPWSSLRKLEFASDKIVYLSDLPAESSNWKPFFRPDKELSFVSQFFAPRNDAALDREPLLLGGRSFRKGLAMHTRTELVIRLPDRFQRLKAVAGIDDRLRPEGRVRLTIRGDERVLLQATIAGSEAPTPLDLDIAGVRRLAIVADFADGLDAGSHLLLGDAKVVK